MVCLYILTAPPGKPAVANSRRRTHGRLGAIAGQRSADREHRVGRLHRGVGNRGRMQQLVLLARRCGALPLSPGTDAVTDQQQPDGGAVPERVRGRYARTRS